LSIAIALMCRPDHLFLFDEPTSGQDEWNKEMLGNLLRMLAQNGYCCVVSTHDLIWARKHATRMITIDDGCIKDDSPVPRHEEEWLVA
jgi:energy-coupling factor transporter ATP-binding protein EcfA2